MLAVGWGDMAILEEVLERAPTHDHKGLSLALQLAIGRRDLPMVEVLIDLAASPRYVELERLFTVDFNRYRLKGTSAEQWRDTSPAAIKLRATMSRRRGLRKGSIGCSGSFRRMEEKSRYKQANVLEAANRQLNEEKGDADKGSGSPSPALRLPTSKASTVSFSQGRLLAMQTSNKRSSFDDTYPFAILSEWIEGYQQSVYARYTYDTLVPSWIDLMLWAVLTGEDALVQPLWAKTRDPLRAALLAAKCCQRLSTLPHLRSDQEHLRQLSTEYEDWAIGLLDAVDEPDAALPLLAMIPSVGAGHQLWPFSCHELAVDFGGRSAPMRRFVAHRHSQYLLEAFFSGDYPNSMARVPLDAYLVQILLQCAFFFLPGTFCEVMPVNAAVMERQRLPTFNMVYQRVDDDDDDEDLEVWDDAKFSARPIGDMHSENGFDDLLDDLRSQRWRYFFSVPKVKFVMYLFFHVAHLLLLLATMFRSSGELATGLSPTISEFEHLFWLWTLLFAFAELKEFRSYDIEGLRMYLRSGWNKLDVLNMIATLTVCLLRLSCDPVDAPANATVAAASDAEAISLSGGGAVEGQCDEEVFSRNLYSLITFLLYGKLLSYAEYNEMIGVHVIIMDQVVKSDVTIFGLLMVLLSCGVGSSFALLLSSYDADLSNSGEGREFSRPFFMPFWALLEPPEVTDMEEAGKGEFPTRIVVPVTLFAYAFGLIVLINLLIAAMTETYQRLRQESTLHYLYERARLIEEFKRKGALPPPLNILTIVLYDLPLVITRILKCCGLTRNALTFGWLRHSARPRDGFKLLPGPEQQRALYRRGRAVLKRFLLRRTRQQQKRLDFQMVQVQKQVTQGFDHSHKNFENLRMQLVTATERLERLELTRSSTTVSSPSPYGADHTEIKDMQGRQQPVNVDSIIAPRRRSIESVASKPKVGSEDAGRRVNVLSTFQKVVLAARAQAAAAAQAGATAAPEPAAPISAPATEANGSSTSPASSACSSSTLTRTAGAVTPGTMGTLDAMPGCRPGSMLEVESTRLVTPASSTVVTSSVGADGASTTMPAPARRARVVPTPPEGTAPAERQELRQEGSINARPVKVRAPSERPVSQKRKPKATKSATTPMATPALATAPASTLQEGSISSFEA